MTDSWGLSESTEANPVKMAMRVHARACVCVRVHACMSMRTREQQVRPCAHVKMDEGLACTGRAKATRPRGRDARVSPTGQCRKVSLHRHEIQAG